MTAAGTVRLRRLYRVCPRCGTSAHPLDQRLGLTGLVSPHAQRLLCLAGTSWSFDRAAANLKEFCGLAVGENTIREVCHSHGGTLRDGQRDDDASAAFRAADGEVEFQTDGTAVNTSAGWRERRLALFAKRQRGQPVAGPDDWEQRDLPTPHVRVIGASLRPAFELGPSWRRTAGRLGLRDTAAITALADGAKWIWRQLEEQLPGAAGVLDFYHASQQLWSAAKAHFGEGTAATRAWVEARRATLLRGGAAALRAELAEPAWAGVRSYFEPPTAHTDYAGRLGLGQSIGSGLVEGACKQVIGRRLKQTGARWRVRRAERMATLCAVQASGQWEVYWASRT